jgi:hypothetical protein
MRCVPFLLCAFPQFAMQADLLHLEQFHLLSHGVALADGEGEFFADLVEFELQASALVPQVVPLADHGLERIGRRRARRVIGLTGDESRAAQDVDAPLKRVDLSDQLAVFAT